MNANTIPVDIPVLVGYLLFGLSELVGMLPIPANGILHSLAVGFKGAIKKPDEDLELAKVLLKKDPKVTATINKLSSNPKLTEVMTIIESNPEMITYIKSINESGELKYIINEFQNNPVMITQAKQTIEKKFNTNIEEIIQINTE